jgi:hypothetical protein
VLFRDYSAERFAFAEWQQSWMRPRRALACGLPKRLWCSQFRIGYRKATSGCSDNRITGIGTTA